MKFARFLKTVSGLCCLASVCLASEDAEATTLLPNGSTTEAPPYSTHGCYIEKSKAADLLIRINRTVQILSKQDRYKGCTEGAKIVDVPAEDFELCSDERIEKIKADLASLTGSLFEAAIQIRNGPVQVLQLETEKVQLMDNLHALRIFYGPARCEGSQTQTVLFPFDASVNSLESSLNSVLALLQTTVQNKTTLQNPQPTTSPTPPPPTTATTPAPDPITAKILNLKTTFAELLKLDAAYPQAMSTALPLLIKQRYTNRAFTFDDILSFVESLSTSENQIIGFKALYETIRDQELTSVPQLEQLDESMKQVYFSVSPSLQSELGKLTRDLGLYVHGERSSCQIINNAYHHALTAADYGSPQSAYLLPNGTVTKYWRVYPFTNSNKHYIRIRHLLWNGFLYAADKNPNNHTSDTIYNAAAYQGYVLSGLVASTQEVDWDIVPSEGNPRTFRLISAKSGEFMYAHESATGFEGMRRVILAKSDFRSHSFIRGADLWYLECKPDEPAKPDSSDD